MQNEQDLVLRAQQRDEAALTQLYEANFDKIYRYVVIKIGDRTEAEDISQQVFLNAFKSISTFKRQQGIPFSAWLYRIAHNQVVDYLRKKAKRPAVPLEKVMIQAEDDPTMTAERNLDMEQLSQAARQLTSAQREVISLRFAGGLSIAEVASVMSKSEGAVKALQHSAIVSLRKLLSV
ncbi:MAG: sigma-70 family RNA polymerase sigma factor [Chloroflexi bacterium]|nr:sigma-70 family RNA polymerase sigma factor [Chloroflexota bacterium]